MAVRAAGLVIYRELGQSIEYLLLQASNQNHHWTPPKGHVDPGEDDLNTAFRETQEEAGISKDQLFLHEDCRDVIEYQAWGKAKVVTYWLARLVNPEDKVTLSHEHQDYKWLEADKAVTLSGFKDMQNTIIKFNHYLINQSS